MILFEIRLSFENKIQSLQAEFLNGKLIQVQVQTQAQLS